MYVTTTTGGGPLFGACRYDQNLVNLAFEILRSDPAAVGEALRAKAESYLASLFPEGG